MSLAQTTTAPVITPTGSSSVVSGSNPSSDATIDVIDSGTEELYYSDRGRSSRRHVARGRGRARSVRRRAVAAPDPRRARRVLRALGAGLAERNDVLGQLWPRESGALYKFAQYAGQIGSGALESYAALADTFPFEEECQPTIGGEFGLLVREPVGVVGAIIPWNAPMALICHKIGPALLAGCTVVLKSSPEAPGEGYVVAEVAEQIGLPPGVLNVVTADREVSELLVRDPDVDKITFTGSTAAGRRIASLCGERIARCTLELGGKSAAVILDDMDLGTAAKTLARAECVTDRAGVLVADADRRHEEPSRRARRRAGGRVLDRCVSVTRSTSRRRWGRWSRSASGIGSRATSPRASTKARRSPPAGVARRTSIAAGTWSRPSSATSTTPRRSRGRRSSGPC